MLDTSDFGYYFIDQSVLNKMSAWDPTDKYYVNKINDLKYLKVNAVMFGLGSHFEWRSFSSFLTFTPFSMFLLQGCC